MPSDWLERPLLGSVIMARGSSPESSGRKMLMIFLVYCIASLFYYVSVLIVSRPYVIHFPTFMARYSLSVLKVSLNPKQTNFGFYDSRASCDECIVIGPVCGFVDVFVCGLLPR